MGSDIKFIVQMGVLQTMIIISLSLLMGFGFIMATPCITNKDCSSTPESGGWGCCSGFGFCVGPGSGWECSGKLGNLGEPSGTCREDADCPGELGRRDITCGVWGWCVYQ